MGNRVRHRPAERGDGGARVVLCPGGFYLRRSPSRTHQPGSGRDCRWAVPAADRRAAGDGRHRRSVQSLRLPRDFVAVGLRAPFLGWKSRGPRHLSISARGNHRSFLLLIGGRLPVRPHRGSHDVRGARGRGRDRVVIGLRGGCRPHGRGPCHQDGALSTARLAPGRIYLRAGAGHRFHLGGHDESQYLRAVSDPVLRVGCERRSGSGPGPARLGRGAGGGGGLGDGAGADGHPADARVLEREPDGVHRPSACRSPILPP